ncbi:MAG: sel1 repeat family protein [Bradyrhizobiaceae bacterium]|nr:sel1 repeat family protein [Bradyrhizobiaceae bacterium]
MRSPTRMIIHAFVVLAVAAGSARAETPFDRAAARGRDEAGGVSSLARRGDAHAETVLGFMYATGRGVPQNFERAVDWYRRAAEQGDPTAQYLLGLMYDKGQGVRQDWVLAHKWLILAAGKARGREREYYARIRDAVAFKLSSEQISEAQSLAAQWRPTRER